MNNMK